MSGSTRSVVHWSVVALIAVAWSVRPAAIPLGDLYAASTPEYPRRSTAHAPSAESDVPMTIDWTLLRTLDHRRGTASDALRALDGKRVRLPGFIVPLDDLEDTVKEFLLVPYYGACVHVPPPPPNQLVYAQMARGSTPTSWWQAVWLEGTLHITRYQSVYGVAGFRMTVERVTPYIDAAMPSAKDAGR
jgi:uncharacterized protein